MLIYAAYLLIWPLTGSPISTVLIYYFRMYRALGDAELLCRCTDRCPLLNNVLGQHDRPLLNVSFQTAPLPPISVAPFYEGAREEYVRLQAFCV